MSTVTTRRISRLARILTCLMKGARFPGHKLRNDHKRFYGTTVFESMAVNSWHVSFSQSENGICIRII